MTFQKSLRRTVNSLIKNFSPWGIYASLASGFLAYQFVSRNWPNLTTAMAAVWAIPVAVTISVVGFLLLAILVAIPTAAKTNSD